MQKNKIEERLSKIILDRTGVDFMENRHKRDEIFWGHNLKIPVRNIVCVLVDVEKQLGVKFTNQDIESGDIVTYNKLLLNIISKEKSTNF